MSTPSSTNMDMGGFQPSWPPPFPPSTPKRPAALHMHHQTGSASKRARHDVGSATDDSQLAAAATPGPAPVAAAAAAAAAAAIALSTAATARASISTLLRNAPRVPHPDHRTHNESVDSGESTAEIDEDSDTEPDEPPARSPAPPPDSIELERIRRRIEKIKLHTANQVDLADGRSRTNGPRIFTYSGPSILQLFEQFGRSSLAAHRSDPRNAPSTAGGANVTINQNNFAFTPNTNRSIAQLAIGMQEFSSVVQSSRQQRQPDSGGHPGPFDSLTLPQPVQSASTVPTTATAPDDRSFSNRFNLDEFLCNLNPSNPHSQRVTAALTNYVHFEQQAMAARPLDSDLLFDQEMHDYGQEMQVDSNAFFLAWDTQILPDQYPPPIQPLPPQISLQPYESRPLPQLAPRILYPQTPPRPLEQGFPHAQSTSTHMHPPAPPTTASTHMHPPASTAHFGISFTDGERQCSAFAAATTAVQGVMSEILVQAPALQPHLRLQPSTDASHATGDELQAWTNTSARSNDQVLPFVNGRYEVAGHVYHVDCEQLKAAANKMSYTGLGDLDGIVEKSIRPFYLPMEVGGILVPPLRLWPKRLYAIWPSFRKQYATFDALSNVAAAFFVASGHAERTWASLSKEDVDSVILAMKSVLFGGVSAKSGLKGTTEPVAKELWVREPVKKDWGALVRVLEAKITTMTQQQGGGSA